jgi:Tfp pilus assembly protein PilN
MEKREQEVHSTAASRPVATPTNDRLGRGARRRASKKMWWIAGAIVVVVALIISGSLYFYRSQIDSSKYQAVFLTNGQVYFGKLHNYYTNRPYLTDVYYIQAPAGSDATAKADTTDTSNQQLVKLGSEVHAPTNEMILNKQSILFVENLTTDGKVVQLIQQNQKSGK